MGCVNGFNAKIVKNIIGQIMSVGNFKEFEVYGTIFQRIQCYFVNLKLLQVLENY